MLGTGQSLRRWKSGADRRKTWEEFRKDQALQRIYDIKAQEMEWLKQAALLGDVRCKGDFILMLNVIRRSRWS